VTIEMIVNLVMINFYKERKDMREI